MIGIGFTAAEKRTTIETYVAEHGVTKVVVIAPTRFQGPLFEGAEVIDWPEVQMYRTFYRLLQEIGPTTLLVLDECLRTQQRSHLNYNCIRHFLAQTEHRLVFNTIPLIDTIEDFMILFDFDTGSRWKREPYSIGLLSEATIQVRRQTYALEPVLVEADAKAKAKYAETKRRLFAELGHGDPHTLPRRLHLLGGATRATAREPGRWYVARNTRMKLDLVTTYDAPAFEVPCGVLDFPHDFITFADFVALSGQQRVQVLVSDLKADAWYLDRYQRWIERVNDAQASLSG